MNIGIVTTWFERGAGYVSKLYRDVFKKENDVFIYARGGEELAKNDPNWDDKSVTWQDNKGNFNSTEIDLKHFEKWISENDIKIILFNEQHWWQPILFCKKIGIITGAYVDYYTIDTIPFFACYDFLICNTERHYSAFEWHPNCYYIPWGTDVDLFKPKQFSPIEKNNVVFFHSCGMSPFRKGTDFIIKAFGKTKGNSKLIIHSQVDLQNKLPQLKSIIKNLEKKNRLEIINKTVTAPGLYHLGDVYLYPSRLEGIGLTIAEALSCGLPVITSDNGPMNEFIDEKENNGLTIPVSKYYTRSNSYYWPICEIDIDKFVEKIEYYISKKNKIVNFKKQTRKYAEKNLNWHKNAEKILKIFKKIKINNQINGELRKDIINYDLKKITIKKAVKNQKSVFLKILSFFESKLSRLILSKEHKYYRKFI